ncbi:hypothetical protein GCM10022261_18670 [Brevibacterium daeguense]|uniref:Uncharacterized protein n=1 Tax=Brevibacterium daeguense TaxID=909936 RepID=A0ABP8EK42_9MICO
MTRSGGFAGMRRSWSVQPKGPDEHRWCRLLDACPWDEAEESRPGAVGSPGADRFVYAIETPEHSITLPESSLVGPWRELVEWVQASDGG